MFTSRAARRFLSLLTIMIGSGATIRAQTDGVDYERILLPVVLFQPVAGAADSLWTTTSGFAMAPVSRSASPPMTGTCARSTSAFPRFRHRHRLRRASASARSRAETEDCSRGQSR
jgi:hypothetical protein